MLPLTLYRIIYLFRIRLLYDFTIICLELLYDFDTCISPQSTESTHSKRGIKISVIHGTYLLRRSLVRHTHTPSHFLFLLVAFLMLRRFFQDCCHRNPLAS